jgi:putative MFS transporter
VTLASKASALRPRGNLRAVHKGGIETSVQVESKITWSRVTLISLGGFFEFYDIFFTGYIAPGLVRSGILTSTTPGLFGSTGIAGFAAALFSGLFIGTALVSFVADRFGRRTIFTYSLLWYTLASVVMAFQHDVFGLNLWRFISGIGVGVELVTIDTYISELVPANLRGRAFAVNQAIQFCAVPVVALLAWLLVPCAPLGLDGWRWVVLLGAAGAILVWWIRRRVPESPRWLAHHRSGKDLNSTSATRHGSFREMWRPPYRTRSMMLIVFHLFQTVGFYGFSNWVPTLLIKRGIAITNSLRYTFIIAIAAPFGPLFAAAIADKLERKWQIVLSAFAIAVSGLLFGQMNVAALLIFFGVLLTLANNVLSFSCHAYQAELYPTRIRALAVGFVYSWSRISVVFSSFVIGFFLERFGVPGVFTLIAGSMLIVMLAIGVLGPRTNNLALETISQ